MDDRLKKVFSGFRGEHEELIPLLQGVQNEIGFLSDDSMEHIARFAKVPLSQIYGVATFYSQFRFKPIGKTHITVCRGTACHVRGSGKILEIFEKKLGIQKGEVSADMNYSLETVACIGACGIAPCIIVNNKVYAKMTPNLSNLILSKETGK
jgi:NADH-quinone oxidoreductase subunit E